MRKLFFVLLSISLSFTGFSQLGGQHVFEFLSLPSSSRVTALGGVLISVQEDDVALALHNPAVLDSAMHNQISVNHNFHLAGISNGFVNYGRNLPWFGLTAHAGIQYVDYGDFQLTDNIGNILGSFDASEMAFVVGAGKQINDRINIGVNVKAIFAGYESYSSSGFATDLGMLYTNPESNFTAGLVVQNLGVQLSTFNGIKNSLPLDIQLGISKKLEHLPFRFSITAHNLQTFGVRYDDPNALAETTIFGEVEAENKFKQGIDNLFRHFVFSGEFLLGKKQNLRLRAGYNHLRRQELKVTRGINGVFSLGFGLKIYKFRIDYGVGYYHLGGNVNHLSISTNLQEFRKKI